MYGATEATARMAYLPPHLTTDHPEAIGIAIPGGRLRLDEGVDERAGVGELVYSGPNVMLGYAESPADLALGREVDELRTGDLAREVDGLFEVVGRLDRRGKVFGLRLDLDGLERHLQAEVDPTRPRRRDRPRASTSSSPSGRGTRRGPRARRPATAACPPTPCASRSCRRCR